MEGAIRAAEQALEHLFHPNLDADKKIPIDLLHPPGQRPRGSHCDQSGHFNWSRQRSFPAVSDDVLLYLSILGAKTSSSFQTWSRIMSTRAMIQEIDSFPLQAEKKSRMTGDTRHQNMVAQAMFSVSRRNGVQGISLSEFLCCLVGEFEEETWTKAMLHDGVSHSLTVSDLLEDYADNLRAMSSETIPFLAPPNTTWPDLMQSANVQGCRFGHLTRAANR